MLQILFGKGRLDARAVECAEGACLVECAGAVDIEDASQFREVLAHAAQLATRMVTLDLRRVTRIDSCGIGEIAHLRAILRPGVRLSIVTANHRLRMLLTMVGMGHLVTGGDTGVTAT